MNSNPDTPQLFLSYRTINANVVRAIDERLQAAGVRVWFAEYDIPIEIYDDLSSIYGSLRQAIESTSHAVVFTNDQFADSRHCQQEVEWILERLSPDRILEVGIPSAR